MPYRPIIGTLAYIWDPKSNKILLIQRNSRPNDTHFGKINGLGGKVEPNESVVEGLKRELFEEANIEIGSPKLRGTVTWTGFGPDREEWLAFIFVVDEWSGTIPERNEEGSLIWLDKDKFLKIAAGEIKSPHKLWSGDHHFLPLVFDNDPKTFHGTMPYDGEQVLSWRYDRI